MSDFASYYASLPDEDLLRLTQDVLSLLPAARVALRAEAQRRNLPTKDIDWNVQPPVLPITLPYAWGSFQGWVMLIFGILTLISMLGIFSSKGDLFELLIVISLCSFSAYLGYALIRRKPHGIILFFIATGIATLFFIFATLRDVFMLFDPTQELYERTAEWWHISYVEWWLISSVGPYVGWWLIPSLFYYRKRLPEFRSALAKPKSATPEETGVS